MATAELVLRRGESDRVKDPVTDYCIDLISKADTFTSDFAGIPYERRTNFALGQVATFRLTELAQSPSNQPNQTALDHLSRYSLARYLAINRKDPDISRRGFFSWPYVAENKLEADPDFQTYSPDDLAIVAFNKTGNVLGLLRMSKPDANLLSLPIDSSFRPDDKLMGVEKIHGRFLDGIGLMGPLEGIRLLSRLSRVSKVPGIPRQAQGLAKAKVTTHLIATAFATTQMLRARGEEIQGTVFDGESYATNAIRSLGLYVQEFSSHATLDTVPPEFIPRYFSSNRGEVHPHLVLTDQLNDPRVRKLYEEIENNSTITYARLLLKHFLVSMTDNSIK
jgi:hypothetical protein